MLLQMLCIPKPCSCCILHSVVTPAFSILYCRFKSLLSSGFLSCRVFHGLFTSAVFLILLQLLCSSYPCSSCSSHSMCSCCIFHNLATAVFSILSKCCVSLILLQLFFFLVISLLLLFPYRRWHSCPPAVAVTCSPWTFSTGDALFTGVHLCRARPWLRLNLASSSAWLYRWWYCAVIITVFACLVLAS